MRSDSKAKMIHPYKDSKASYRGSSGTMIDINVTQVSKDSDRDRKNH